MDLNKEQDNISSSIKQAAEDEIPQKKVLNLSCNKASKKIHSELQIAINIIKKLVKKYKREIETKKIEKNKQRLNKKLKK